MSELPHPTFDFRPVLDHVLRQFSCAWYGVHGLAHWGRVLDNGLRLAHVTGADPDVVTLFALFHDSKRVHDGHDPAHGARGAEHAMKMRGTLYALDDDRAELLYDACEHHSAGRVHGPITVQTCWDADRLDLLRVGIRPEPDRLCTEAARDPELMAWANQRAEAEVVPAVVEPVWEASMLALARRTPNRTGG